MTKHEAVVQAVINLGGEPPATEVEDSDDEEDKDADGQGLAYGVLRAKGIKAAENVSADPVLQALFNAAQVLRPGTCLN